MNNYNHRTNYLKFQLVINQVAYLNPEHLGKENHIITGDIYTRVHMYIHMHAHALSHARMHTHTPLILEYTIHYKQTKYKHNTFYNYGLDTVT